MESLQISEKNCSLHAGRMGQVQKYVLSNLFHWKLYTYQRLLQCGSLLKPIHFYSCTSYICMFTIYLSRRIFNSISSLALNNDQPNWVFMSTYSYYQEEPVRRYTYVRRMPNIAALHFFPDIHYPYQVMGFPMIFLESHIPKDFHKENRLLYTCV